MCLDEWKLIVQWANTSQHTGSFTTKGCHILKMRWTDGAIPIFFSSNILHLMVWQCVAGEDLKKAGRLSWILIALGKHLKSLQVKCIRIHINRNHIRPLAEKSFIAATYMHVGFKVQLVVEFYIYHFYLDQSHIQKKCPKTLSRHMWRCPIYCPIWQYCFSVW